MRCLILGAGGRDFHDFLTWFRPRADLEVVAFTAAQIPFIAERTFPAELAGPRYPAGIPIFPEDRLEELIAARRVEQVFLAYSDLSHEQVMHLASRALAAGAGFSLLAPESTQLVARRPVVAVTASRTGAGKSPLSLAIAEHMVASGRRVAVLRHPMPYGDLARQAVQRFASPADLDAARCTIEEREEYAPYLEHGLVVHAGVDYAAILARAEEECDVVIWDGGNNDHPFIRPTVWIAVLDGLRPGHEERYHPGEVNLRRAGVVVINKVGSAKPALIEAVRARARALNPRAEIVESDLEVSVDDPARIAGRRVLVVEDGPTLTHGGMSHGAGLIAARRFDAREVIDPRGFATGSIREAYRAYPHIGPVLPALGYSDAQRAELARTIDAAEPELILDASPARIDRFLSLAHPVARVSYHFVQRRGPPLLALIDRAIAPGEG